MPLIANIGTYGDNEKLDNPNDCKPCPPGAYCPVGTMANPTVKHIPCPAGTYNPNTKSSELIHCLLCKPGMTTFGVDMSLTDCNGVSTNHLFITLFCSGFCCPQTGMTKGDEFSCEEGHYCPAGTIAKNQYPCLPGTYSGETNLTSVDECITCPERFFCLEGTGVTINPMQACKAGFFCPRGTPVGNRHPCPPGTFSNSSQLASSSECSDCPPSYYCFGEGEDSPSGKCPPGYYCPKNTRYPSEYPCNPGTYNPDYGKVAQSDCKNCTQGSFCESGKPQPEKCPIGTYMPYGVEKGTTNLYGETAKAIEDCLACPGGSKCDEGTITPSPCGKGKFSKTGDGRCKLCSKGHFCSNDTTSMVDMESNMQCQAGTLCGEGLKNNAEAIKCPKGHFCPMGTPVAIACMVGTFNPNLGGEAPHNCTPCTPGYYCTEANEDPKGLCQPGYYCASPINNPFASKNQFPFIGSYGPMQFPCPEGTYIDVAGSKSKNSCLNCPAGSYCSLGTSKPELCPRGSFCRGNSSEPTPCSPGYYGSSTGLTQKDQCTVCDQGQYCDSPGLSRPRGLCDPGYLCYNGSKVAAPTDGIQGIICPVGGYCPEGSFVAKPCPVGTYSNAVGAVNTADCRDCDPGYYCSEINGGDKTGECWGGYYCPGRSPTPMQNITDPGHFSKNGSRTQDACQAGEYQPNHGQSSCLMCEAGYYCDQEKMTEMKVCPVGHFCVANSTGPEPCPRGTFSNATGRKHRNDCNNCPKGMYCQDIKLIEPTGECEAGFFCWGGALSPEPVFNNDTSKGEERVVYGDQCQPGHYCPKGTTLMIPCKPGYYNPILGSKNEQDCLPCPIGKYCNDSGLSSWTGKCSPGYFCNGKASIPNPPNSLCPLNSFCPEGTERPQPCEDGQFTDTIGAKECQWCPSGHYCDSKTGIKICKPGHYCPASTQNAPISSKVLNQYVCEIGSFNPKEGMSSPDNCTACLAGKFCSSKGLSQPNGDIAAGFYSIAGASVAEPTEDHAEKGVRGRCPIGYYCPKATGNPRACPAGTFGLAEGYKTENDCRPSCAGYYINSTGVPAIEGQNDYPHYCPGSFCHEGYWCNPGNGSVGSNVPNPIGKSYGDICPRGFFCEEKSERPQSCPPGYYTDSEGQSSCKSCPERHFCTIECQKPELCPTGYYCPTNTKFGQEFPCPGGTYNNVSGMAQKKDCVPCLPGYFCTNGTSIPTQLCDPGSFCPQGSSSSVKKCPVGSYCPEGSAHPIPCDGGTYCPRNSLSSPTGNCSEGYFCKKGSANFQPSKQSDNLSGPCPLGHYCPAGSISGFHCPEGTYQDSQGSVKLDDCKNCTAGSFCKGYGNEKPSGL